MRNLLMNMRYFIYLIGMIALAGCEDVVDIDLKEGEQRLVIDAFLNNKFEKQSIRISYTAPYFSNVPTPPETNATALLINQTTGDTVQFLHEANGEYTFLPDTNYHFFRINHIYKLHVTLNNVHYEATSVLNRTTTIDSFIVQKGGGNFGTSKDKYYAGILARDIQGDTDYYWIKSYINGKFLNRPGQINLAVDGASGEGADGFYFTPNIALAITPNDGLSLGDSVLVEIYSLNRETWRFMQQAQNEMTNGGLFARTPENVASNIRASDGSIVLGFFNVGASSLRGTTIKE